MRNHLILMVSHRRLGHRAHVASPRFQHIWVIRWQDSGRGADNRAQGVVHFLGLGVVDSRLERGALCCGCAVGGDGRVRVQVVVMVGCCSYDRALEVLLVLE